MQEVSTPSVSTHPNSPWEDHTVPQPLWKDPSALEMSWRPPTLVGRDTVLAGLEATALSGLTPGRRVVASISGPRGSGSSAIAYHLVATALARLERPGARGAPLLLRADLCTCRSANAVVTALFRGIDPQVQPRGASTELLGLLLLRRLRTEGRPAIFWIDQVLGADGDLARVLRPLTQPERTLPEGPKGLPTMLVIVSGDHDPLPPEVEAVRVQLAPLQGRDLCAAIMARANAGFNAPPSPEAVTAIANIAVSQGRGLSVVGDLLAEAGRRAEARGGRWLEAEDVAVPLSLKRGRGDAKSFQALLLRVLGRFSGTTTVGLVRQELERECAEAGIALPTSARLWRHMIALERHGLLRREVRLGGAGGSVSTIRLAMAPPIS
jgi:hypothetical protein